MSVIVGGRRAPAVPADALVASARCEVHAPIAHVWACLTTPLLIRGWFADADRFGLDEWFEYRFGDGDFFVARIVDRQPPTTLTLHWRFFGIGPLFEIRYELAPIARGTLVIVTDRGAPTDDERRSLREGWADFLERLSTFATAGRPSRFAWSETIGAGILVEASGGIPRELAEPRWLGEMFPDARVQVRAASHSELLLTFHERAWGATPTEARVRYAPVSNAAHLTVVHTGWPALDPHLQHTQRRRYAALWQHALAALEAAHPPAP